MENQTEHHMEHEMDIAMYIYIYNIDYVGIYRDVMPIVAMIQECAECRPLFFQ